VPDGSRSREDDPSRARDEIALPGALALPGAALLRLELFVGDLARSLGFYEQALGFEEQTAAGRPRSRDYVQIASGRVRIGLCPVTSLPASHYFARTTPGSRPGIGVEIVLEVDDLLGYERRARLAGAVFEPLRERPWGRRDFRLVDPDGYYIRVTETREEIREGTRRA
jgi:lactoylglutathione lyase